MKSSRTIRKHLLAPLVYLAALILMLEDWLWDLGLRLTAFIVAWPPLEVLERRLRALPPYAALCVFVLPGLLLLPVKILALFAIARGHAFSGIAVIVLAKVGGAALVARLYVLTRPALLSLAWFARWHGKFMELKDRWVTRLRQTDAFRRVTRLSTLMRAGARAAMARLRRPGSGQVGRNAARPARMLRRFIAMLRARR
jgi:hypothetical protein